MLFDPRLSGQELALAVLSFEFGVEPDQQLELAIVFALVVHEYTLGLGVLQLLAVCHVDY